jgi:endogenous inhibitor of DNA gyrase (YacG/DUF329 family)
MTRRCPICGDPLTRNNRAACCLECRILAQAAWFEDEVWLPIVGHPAFQISDQGRVRDARTRIIREPDRSGRYPRVSLAGHRRAVHTLMAETWLGPRPFGQLVLHGDDDPAHTALPNISYGSAQQNADEARRNRTSVGKWLIGKEEHR